jgi:mono/diheme cytochrome c family protein
MKSWANLVPWASSLAALLIGTMVPAADAANAANESVAARDVQALDHYHNVISPILKAHCYECHGDGARKAGLAFDALLTKDQIPARPTALAESVAQYKVARHAPARGGAAQHCGTSGIGALDQDERLRP